MKSANKSTEILQIRIICKWRGGEKEAKMIGLMPYLCYVAVSGLRFIMNLLKSH